MTLATDIASDLAIMDGVETVSVYSQSANTTDSAVTALRGPLSHRELMGGGPVGLESKDVVFQLQENTVTTAPENGDKITDAGSVAFNILSAQKMTLGTRWRCLCRQQK